MVGVGLVVFFDDFDVVGFVVVGYIICEMCV